ncbi:hypothetical protein SKAU_G00413450 [Synaphobranchus kaupii]|uniref:Tesmin/TSO1-like CXC domain-containing protein n=1 Tax=Synaphobranchus kaupii TaxID=118154 RepID=A0A9Q1E889_SYNKA|nr:hypothetical protein SKAU_G00413450 [Synaphobranchus kaupii]
MATTTKSIQVGDSKICDLNAMYSRVIALFSSDRDVDVKDVLAYELAPIPTAMFTEDGMRICKAKSTLKKSLQVEVSRRNAHDADVTVIDGSALLWIIHWQADGTVADFIENVKTRLTSYLSDSDVYLIFDRMEERRSRCDLENQQEEADTIIVQQVLGCAGEAYQISVVSDDTDVFVLLLHHYHQAGLDVPLIMESPSKERAIVDIKSTLAKHSQIVKNLLPAHAISGCDTVASYYGLGKGCVIKVLKAGYELSAIGNVDAPFQQVLNQATAFISACYGIKESTDMSHTRLLVWGKKNGKGHMSAPNLAALPLTTEAFIENVKRAHFQAILWRNVNVNLPSALNPEEFGWKKYTCNRSLSPTNLPEDAKFVPDYILEMIRCGCKSETPCNKKCNCKVHGLPCTMFCACFRVGCSRSKY